jgi:zinc transporter
MPQLEPPTARRSELVESVYGSDKYGLIWGYVFAPDTAAREIEADSAAAWLSTTAQEPSDAFLWLHFSLANTAAVRWLRTHLDLPDSFYESLQENAVSTRLEQEGSDLVAVILDVQFDSTVDSSNISSVSMCIGPRLMITARLRPLRSVDRLRAAVKAGHGFRSSAELLAQLLREQAGVLVDILRQSTARVDAIEDKLLAAQITTSRRELGSLRRILVRLQRLLAPEPAALFRLLNRPPRWIADEDVQELRQSAEEFATAVADSSALTERVKLLQEEFTAVTTEQTNKTLFVLTLVTVLALPINLIAGLFGMNVGGIPLAGHAHGFMVVVLLLAAITGTLAYIVLGRNRD